MSRRSSPTSCSSRVSSWPAAPTKGLPSRSSVSPGASPTAMMRAVTGPYPGTACVRVTCSAQAVQARMRPCSSRSSSVVTGIAQILGSDRLCCSKPGEEGPHRVGPDLLSAIGGDHPAELTCRKPDAHHVPQHHDLLHRVLTHEPGGLGSLDPFDQLVERLHPCRIRLLAEPRTSRLDGEEEMKQLRVVEREPPEAIHRTGDQVLAGIVCQRQRGERFHEQLVRPLSKRLDEALLGGE